MRSSHPIETALERMTWMNICQSRWRWFLMWNTRKRAKGFLLGWCGRSGSMFKNHLFCDRNGILLVVVVESLNVVVMPSLHCPIKLYPGATENVWTPFYRLVIIYLFFCEFVTAKMSLEHQVHFLHFWQIEKKKKLNFEGLKLRSQWFEKHSLVN